MDGLSIGQIVLHGFILSIGASIIVLGGMTLNPRVMLTDYPPEIKARLAPMNVSEKRQQAVLGILFFGYTLAVLFYSNAQEVARSGQAEFLPLLINTYIIFEIANLFDLLVLDYLVLMVIQPKFLFIAEAEGLAQYQTFRRHFIGFLKGLLIGLVISLVVALVSVIIL